MKWYEKLHKDIENLNISIEKIFENTAHEIMNNNILYINTLKVELTEIEFYYFNCSNHNDYSVHISKLQKETCDFLYVHPKSWYRGGIDITFGNGNDCYFGGILIRGIKLHDKFIAGPATIKKFISKEIAKKEITEKEISNYKELQEYFNKHRNKIYLKKKEKNDCTIICSKRVGLNEYNNEEFYNAKYRFIREDYLLKNNKGFDSYSNVKDRLKLKKLLKK